MTTETPNIPGSHKTDRDYLEMLMNKLKVMKAAGNAYYANKTMDTLKREFDKAKRDVNEFYTLLIKRGYDQNRFDEKKPVQKKLYE